MTQETVMVGGRTVRVVRIGPGTAGSALAELLAAAGLPTGVPVVVLVGGASGLDGNEAEVCSRLIGSALVPVIEERGAVLVDGGTDSGVMALAGQARRLAGCRGAHVGVVAAGTVAWPSRPSSLKDAVPLEPNHTHVVAVPGTRWGDEAPWLAAVATALCSSAQPGTADAPSVTVLANGGDLAYGDVHESISAGRPVLVLSGTGRTATEIADARAGRPAGPRATELAGSPLVTVLPDDPEVVRSALGRELQNPVAWVQPDG